MSTFHAAFASSLFPATLVVDETSTLLERSTPLTALRSLPRIWRLLKTGLILTNSDRRCWQRGQVILAALEKIRKSGPQLSSKAAQLRRISAQFPALPKTCLQAGVSEAKCVAMSAA